MCDHCKTYKPMLEEPVPYSYNKPTSYSRDRPSISATPQASASDKGCCSWRQTCCDGGCCSRIGNCCSTEPETKSQPYEKAPPPVSYGYGYGSAGTTRLGLLPMTMDSMPDRVPCKREEKREVKLPMCYGGDCSDSGEDLSGKNDEKRENGVSQSTPGQ